MTVRKMNPFVAPNYSRTAAKAEASAESSSGKTSPSPPPAAGFGGIDIKKIISGFKTDDYILIGLIAVLFFEGCDDYILLAALGYLFIMGILQESD